ITIGIAIGGFRTFGRWKREKIEERRIDIALEALSLAYEVQGVFDAIRNPGAFSYEYQDMPRAEGESDDSWRYRTTYYVPLKRINDYKDFFMRALKLQPRLMAMFGPEVDAMFTNLNEARIHVQVSAGVLMRQPEPVQPLNEERQRVRNRMEADIWSGAA